MSRSCWALAAPQLEGYGLRVAGTWGDVAGVDSGLRATRRAGANAAREWLLLADGRGSWSLGESMAWTGR